VVKSCRNFLLQRRLSKHNQTRFYYGTLLSGGKSGGKNFEKNKILPACFLQTINDDK
jgi:hypothetical protein